MGTVWLFKCTPPSSYAESSLNLTSMSHQVSLRAVVHSVTADDLGKIRDFFFVVALRRECAEVYVDLVESRLPDAFVVSAQRIAGTCRAVRAGVERPWRPTTFLHSQFSPGWTED